MIKNSQEMSDEELISYYNNEKLRSEIENNSQMAAKILLNSFFGAYGNASFRYYSLDHAKSITLSGQAGIRYVTKKVNDWLQSKVNTNKNFVLYNDTDSLYLTLKPLLDKYNLDPVKDYNKSKELIIKFTDGPMAKFIKDTCEEFAVLRNAKKNYLDMEREAISVRGGIFVAAKKYALMVDDLEGVAYTQDKPYMKVMGLEISKPGKFSESIRGWLKVVLDSVLIESETETQKKIAGFKSEFMDKPLTEIGFLTMVNAYDKWLDGSGNLKSGTPIGPKAIHVHNTYLDKIGDVDVARLKPGDKIYYVPLRKGNPAGADSIGFVEWTGGLETLTKWVDKETLWTKNFISPASIMLTSVGWSATKQNSLF